MNIKGYDEWKLRSPEDEMNPMDEARAEIEMWQKLSDKYENALHECLEWFEERATVEEDGTPWGRENPEMKMAQMLKEVLR